jgi:ribose-phosphate pyrophosphokinase
MESSFQSSISFFYMEKSPALHYKPVLFERIQFPAGETGIKLDSLFLPSNAIVCIGLLFRSNNDLFDLAQLVDALRRRESTIKIKLLLPYVPYARQDRVTASGTSLSIKVFADFLNSLKLDQVVVVDPHSYVTPALLDRCAIVSQEDAHLCSGQTGSYDVIVAPDAGAVKKAEAVAGTYISKPPVIYAHKVRDPATGALGRASLSPSDMDFIHGKRVLVVDDICDGGGTFIALGKVLREAGVFSMDLWVTHGIFTKGKEELNALYDRVGCAYDFTEQRIQYPNNLVAWQCAN